MDVRNSKPVAQIVAAIAALDLDPIKVKLMEVEEGEGWSKEQVDRVETSYRRYLTLLVKYPETPIAPSKDIDKFWHGHILDTMKYEEDCKNVFGYFLHHFPYFGMRGEEDAAQQVQADKDMHRLYEQEFGEPMSQSAAAYCAATVKAAYCAASKPAYCAATVTAAAYCAATAKTDAAYCAASKPAYCAATVKTAAYCAATAKTDAAYCAASKPAYCAATVKTETSKAAYCAATVKASAAYCAASKPAYCAATVKAKAAYCAATVKKTNDAVYCAAATRAAYCAATSKQPDFQTRPVLAMAA